MYAQAFLDNSEKLQQMAEIVSRGFENAKANEQTYGSRESGVRFSKEKQKKYPETRDFAVVWALFRRKEKLGLRSSRNRRWTVGEPFLYI